MQVCYIELNRMSIIIKSSEITAVAISIIEGE